MSGKFDICFHRILLTRISIFFHCFTRWFMLFKLDLGVTAERGGSAVDYWARLGSEEGGYPERYRDA